jgi:transcriptional regulator with XRE-family HTH domain
MKSFKRHLQEELQDADFGQAFNEEVRLAHLAVQISKSRESKGLTQAQLATRAHITQQQISKVEHAGSSGFNVNTLLKVCDALGLDLTLSPKKSRSIVAVRKTMGRRAIPKKSDTSTRSSLPSKRTKISS